MASFKNINALIKHISLKVEESLGDEVANMVKDKQQEHINDDVYMQYNVVDGQRKEPYKYERRYFEGGLIDRDNIVAEVKDGTLTVTNVTEGKDGLDNLAGLIEFGDKNGFGEYDWKYNKDNTQDQYLQPRPFIDNTRQEIAEKSLHKKALIEGLKKRGIKAK